MKKPKESPIDLRALKISIKRRSDAMLGITSMDYDTYCTEIDELVPANMFDFVDGSAMYSTRNMTKGLAKMFVEGDNYYEHYLNTWYNMKGMYEEA